jgi:hypothetical protein
MVVAFAILTTAHVALVAALAAREPRWRAAVALAVPPLAPFWGMRAHVAHVKVWAAVWVVSALAYVAVRWAAA